MRVYLASPLGFAESTLPFLRRLVELVTDAGLEPIDPWSLPVVSLIEEARAVTDAGERAPRLREANRKVAAANKEAIDASDLVVAVLDGADVDSGTAAEIGYAYAAGKRVVGIRTDSRSSGDNEAAVVNLQLQYFIEASGGVIVRSTAELAQYLRSHVSAAKVAGS